MLTLSSSSDDNETARYLAAYIIDNVEYSWDGPILEQDRLTEIIKEFYAQLP